MTEADWQFCPRMQNQIALAEKDAYDSPDSTAPKAAAILC
jgi:hypothetical protein